MRILLSGIDLRGHRPPMLAISDALERGGHEVAWWTASPMPDVRVPQLESRYILGDDDPSRQLIRREYAAFFAEHSLSDAFRDPATLVRLRALTLRLMDAEARIARAVIRHYQPDIVAIDGAAYGRMLGCHLEGIPFVGVCTGLQYLAPPGHAFPETHLEGDLVERRRARFARHGCDPEFREWYCLSPYLNLVFATRALVGNRELPPRTWLVGHAVSESRRAGEAELMGFSLDRLSRSTPLVYASFGSMHHDRRLARTIAAAAEHHGAQLVLSASDASSLEGCLPASTLMAEQVPQLDVLRRARAFVTHGGANSLMEALYMGVPMLITPLCTDQPLNASIVRALGARAPGLVLERHEATPRTVATAIGRLLWGPYRSNARAIQASYRKSAGGDEAARLIVETARALAGTRLPWQRSAADRAR